MLGLPGVSAIIVAGLLLQAPPATSLNEELWAAARAGDVARIAHALDEGADVNAKTGHGVTALWFAADRGHLDAVRLLIDRGADMHPVDVSWSYLPLDRALINEHFHVARFLLERGSRGAAGTLVAGIRARNIPLVEAALSAPDLDLRALVSAAQTAAGVGEKQIAALVQAALDKHPAEAVRAATIDAAVLRTYAGTYRHDGTGLTMTITPRDAQLVVESPGQPTLTLVPTSQTTFRAAEVEGQTFVFAGDARIDRLIFHAGRSNTTLERVASVDANAASPEPVPPLSPSADPATPTPQTQPLNWPSFRGVGASGVADGQGAVAAWDVRTGQNVKWKTPIPGIATSSPIVWGDLVIVTTAIGADTTFRTGHYRDIRPVDDASEHTWKIYALHKTSGRVVWEREVFRGTPKTRRHAKSSQANSTPVTDGRHIVAVFGSAGLIVCYDMSGKLLWKREIGVLDSGWALDASYQWGHASSPIIYQQTVIVQADRPKGSFLAAYDLATGKEAWRTERDEISTWGTPTIFKGEGQDELVTNGTKIRGYDPDTGKLLWTLEPNSEITVGTPVAGSKLVYVTGGYPPVRPIYAIRPGARGDISLSSGAGSNASIAWSNDREGTYIPTPILYRGYLYTCNNNGIITAYDAETGHRIYRWRLGRGGAFSASPVAADGRLYFASEDGEIYVVRAAPKYEEMAWIEMGEVIMATPAISDGLIVVRTLRHVYGIGQ